MNNLWNREPALVLGALGAVLSLGLAFGLSITPQQIGAIMAAASALIAVITRQTVTSPQTLQDMTPATLKAAQETAPPVKDTVRKLPVVLLACTLAMSSACASLHRADGSWNTSVILNDARWGLMAGCDSQDPSPAECVFGFDLLTLADGIAASNLKGSAVAVRQLFVDSEARLPPDSRLRPYLDAVIALLPEGV